MDKVDQKETSDLFKKIWLRLQENTQSQIHPKAFILGGQPGSGKSRLTNNLQLNDFKNKLAVIINGDEFREFHPRFSELQNKYGKDAVRYTGSFSGAITELAIQKAIKEKKNIIIEGTFRTSEIPIKTLQLLKENGYKTGVAIQTCPSYVSWESTLERYETAKKVGLEPRATPKEHHDLVVANLGKNADKVLSSGLADTFKVYSRQGLIFDKNQHKEKPSISINNELNKTKEILQNKNTQRNQSSIYEYSKNSLNKNIHELKSKNSFFHSLPIESLSKIAFYRGILQKENENQPLQIQQEKINAFDKKMQDTKTISSLPNPFGFEKSKENQKNSIDDQSI